MKKFLRTLLPLCLLLICIAAFSSCGGDASNTTPSVTTTAPVTTTIPEGPTGVEIEFNTLTLTGTSTYDVLPNATKTFSFLSEVVVARDATYKVAADIYGRDILHSKTVPLEEGDNTFYIIVENGNDMGFYTVTLRRRPMYTVKVNNGDGTTTRQVEEGRTAIIETPSRKGYQFLGWSEDTAAPITENKTFVAKWEILTYNITYMLNDGANATQNPATYTVEDQIILSTPTRPGYRFLGWKQGGKAVAAINKGTTGDKTLVAEWTQLYSITYELNGGTNATKNPTIYTKEDSITLAKPTRLGYRFLGWKLDGETAAGIVKGTTGDKTFVAEWEINTYNITYEINGGENPSSNPSTYTAEDTVKLAPPPPRDEEGLAFVGWFINGKKADTISAGTTSGDLKITAKWDYIFDWDLEEKRITRLTDVGESYLKSNGGRLTIPATISGCSISYIGYFLYDNRGASGGASLVKSVVIMDGITTIGSEAFYGCTGLTSITIPESVTSIGESAFESCTGLTSITIPSSVTSIGYETFNGCTGLTSVIFEKGSQCTSIGNYAFEGCTRLTSITIPSSVTSIGKRAFYGCTGLTSVTFEEGSQCSSIDMYAFSGCTGLESITIPDSVTTIGLYAFENCTTLKTITLPNGVSYINKWFTGCTLLESITIPESVTHIGDGAFSGFTSLKSITIPDGVTSIGASAFSDCTSLESVTIPDSVTYIGVSAFKNCTNIASATMPILAISSIPQDSLTTVIINGGTSITNWAFDDCVTLESITILDGVTSIGSNAFSGCTSLKNVTLPDGITTINNWVFDDCAALESIVIPNSVTYIGSVAFNNCASLSSVTFENTSGWTAGNRILSSTDLADPATAATYLTDTYDSYTWTRS